TWTRDYAPLTIRRVHSDGSDSQLIFKDFKFNGWGLKFASSLDNLATSRLCDTGLLNGIRDNQLNVVLEGGAIESDGKGTILTTASCLLSPNRNGAWSRAQIDEYLKEQFGLDRVIWLENGQLDGDDTDGHIDTLARFAPEGDIIFFDSCDDRNDPHYEPLLAMRRELEAIRTADGHPYHLVELPIPGPVFDPATGERLPATYANFLYLNGAVLLPVYGQPMNDLEAKMTLARWLPGYEIIPVNCLALVRQHGSLHCATMQLPEGALI
ncbi:MAG: agmatine deiminase family protein, partial [Muribaculaceae bacterium]|nr:agmatine deiminase family protein [Muribaculaceae bacterium]